MDPENVGNRRIKKAIEDVSENVSVAGLREAITENSKLIRLIFLTALTICLGCTVYYTWRIIVEWTHSGFATDIQDVYGLESLPLTNVTVCADVNINETHVKQNITIPSQLAEHVENITGYTKNEFFEYFLQWITPTTTDRSIPPKLRRYFRILLAANPQTAAFTDFLRSSFTPCQSMIQNCTLDGVPFDCCVNSKTQLDNSGLCYQIVMSHDVSSIDHFETTRRQKVPGNMHGLSFEVSMDLGDILWLENDMSAGFKIYPGPVGFPPFENPLVAPSSAETFVKLIVTERILSSGCLPGNKLPPTFNGGYYDPHGVMCAEGNGVKLYHSLFNCYAPYFHNDAPPLEQCGPEVNEGVGYVVAQTDAITEARKTAANQETPSRYIVESVVKTVTEAEQFIGDSIVDMSRHNPCQKRCRYWDYSGTVSYIDLEGNNSTNKGTLRDNVLYSRIHIYYPDFSYRQYSESTAVSQYTAFCNFGNVIGFYLGLSMVGIAEVLYWLGRLIIIVYREKYLNKYKVQPFTQE